MENVEHACRGKCTAELKQLYKEHKENTKKVVLKTVKPWEWDAWQWVQRGGWQEELAEGMVWCETKYQKEEAVKGEVDEWVACDCTERNRPVPWAGRPFTKINEYGVTANLEAMEAAGPAHETSRNL